MPIQHMSERSKKLIIQFLSVAKLAKARDCNEYLKVILRSGVRLTPGRLAIIFFGISFILSRTHKRPTFGKNYSTIRNLYPCLRGD